MIKKLTAGLGALALVATLSACTEPTQEELAREALQKTKPQGDTLEKKNLEAKRQREENPDATRYLYLYSYGEPMGYYITKGKISSSGSQRTPEQDNMWTCRASSSSTCEAIVVDGAKDDGSYGDGDPGIFFFLANGQMVETTFDFIISDAPINAANIPLLGGSA